MLANSLPRPCVVPTIILSIASPRFLDQPQYIRANDIRSVLVFGRREQDQLHPIATIDIGVMPWGYFKEVTGAYVRLDAGVDHANDELSGNTVARVSHRAGVLISTES